MSAPTRRLDLLDDDVSDTAIVRPSSYGYAQPLGGVPEAKDLERKIPIGFVPPKPPRKPPRRK